jgi:hypothetical protein
MPNLQIEKSERQVRIFDFDKKKTQNFYCRILHRNYDPHTKRPIKKQPITKWSNTNCSIAKGPITNSPDYKIAHHQMTHVTK